MEKRLTLALFLCLAFMFIYQGFLSPPKPKPTPTPAPAGTQDPAQETPKDPVQPVIPVVPEDEIRKETLENESIRVVITNVGGAIESAVVKDFWPTAEKRRDGGAPLHLLVPSKDGLHALRLDDLLGGGAPLGSRIWTLTRLEDGQGVAAELSFMKGGDDGVRATIRKEFRVPDAKAHAVALTMTLRLEGSGGAVRAFPARFQLLVSGGVFQEAGQASMSPPLSVVSEADGEVEVVMLGEVLKRDEGGRDFVRSVRETDATGVGKAVGGAVRFAGDLGNYLGAVFVAKEFPATLVAQVHRVSDPGSGMLSGREDEGDPTARTATALRFELDLKENAAPVVLSGLLYLGPIAQNAILADLAGIAPSEATALGAIDDHQLGWARAIGKIVLFGLRTLNGLTGNWGWAIVLLTICVRLILFPVNRRAQTAMARQAAAMAKLKPKLDELKKKHEKDPRAFAAAQMELMKREKVSLVPLGGCLPIFLQIPIFFGLFAALRHSLDLRQASWLWVQDLSKPDHLIRFQNGLPNPLSFISCCGFPQSDKITGFHILPLLMTAAWVLSSMMAPKPATMDPQMAQQRKIMMIMPVFFGLTMYNYAAGLSLYWLTSSLMGMAESRIIRKFWPVGGQGTEKGKPGPGQKPTPVQDRS